MSKSNEHTKLQRKKTKVMRKNHAGLAEKLENRAFRRGTSAFLYGLTPMGVSDHLPITATIQPSAPISASEAPIKLVSWNLLCDDHLFNNFFNITGRGTLAKLITERHPENIYYSTKKDNLHHLFSELAEFFLKDASDNKIMITPEKIEQFKLLTAQSSHLTRSRDTAKSARLKTEVTKSRHHVCGILSSTLFSSSNPSLSTQADASTHGHELRLALQHAIRLYYQIKGEQSTNTAAAAEAQPGQLSWERRRTVLQQSASSIELLQQADILCLQECTEPKDIMDLVKPGILGVTPLPFLLAAWIKTRTPKLATHLNLGIAVAGLIATAVTRHLGCIFMLLPWVTQRLTSATSLAHTHSFITHKASKRGNDHCVLAYNKARFALISAPNKFNLHGKPCILTTLRDKKTNQICIAGSIHHPGGQGAEQLSCILEKANALQIGDETVPFYIAGDFNHRAEEFDLTSHEAATLIEPDNMGTMAGNDYGNSNKAIDLLLTNAPASQISLKTAMTLQATAPDPYPYRVDFRDQTALLSGRGLFSRTTSPVSVADAVVAYAALPTSTEKTLGARVEL